MTQAVLTLRLERRLPQVVEDVPLVLKQQQKPDLKAAGTLMGSCSGLGSQLQNAIREPGRTHLAGPVQARLHASLQVVQGDRLQDVEVVSHLILDRTRTQDDVLLRDKHTHAQWKRLQRSEVAAGGGASHLVDVLTQVLLVQELKHDLEEREELKSDSRWR